MDVAINLSRLTAL